MDPELKAKWVAALRSGKFRQGRNLLKHAGRYCCLGVLCEVAGEPVAHLDSFPSPAFLQRSGVRGAGLRLSEMNDVARVPFPGIADWIEANL